MFSYTRRLRRLFHLINIVFPVFAVLSSNGGKKAVAIRVFSTSLQQEGYQIPINAPSRISALKSSLSAAEDYKKQKDEDHKIAEERVMFNATDIKRGIESCLFILFYFFFSFVKYLRLWIVLEAVLGVS